MNLGHCTVGFKIKQRLSALQFLETYRSAVGFPNFGNRKAVA